MDKVRKPNISVSKQGAGKCTHITIPTLTLPVHYVAYLNAEQCIGQKRLLKHFCSDKYLASCIGDVRRSSDKVSVIVVQL
jgi:hypothetical protein